MDQEGHAKAWRRLLHHADWISPNPWQHHQKNRWTPTEFSFRVVVVGMGLALLISIAMIILLAKNYQATPPSVLMVNGFKDMCDGFSRKGGEVSFVVETKDYYLCLSGDPRYKFDVKAIAHREDLK